MNDDEAFQLDLAHTLLLRLERLSADSYWAHRASGTRGSLIKCVVAIETTLGKQKDPSQGNWNQLRNLIDKGFWILEQAAREINTGDTHQS